MEYINLPHKDENNWNKICEKYIKKSIKNFSDLNVIFFDGKYPFFNEINKNYKKEGDEFVKVYKYLQKLILNLDEKILPYEIKILKTKENDKLELTRRQVAILFLLAKSTQYVASPSNKDPFSYILISHNSVLSI